MQIPQSTVFTVTQFNETVKEILFGLKVWIRGEISGFKISQNKWVTFDIKDEGSKLNCFMTVYQLDQQLEDGMEVKIFGNPSVYVPYGKYSFTVQRVQPVGEGALRKAFELTKKKLADEGLFLDEHKKAIPRFPEKIGIVTSEDAAAYTDVLRILQNRWSGMEITLRPSLVQGVNAPDELVCALEWFNQYYPVDVIILTRGGGSLEDLQAFNSELVCRSVFASRIPVICAIGHERDSCLAEMVADVRASTPSNAAEMAVPEKKDILVQLNQSSKDMEGAIMGELEQKKWLINQQVSRLDAILRQYKNLLADYWKRMNFGFMTLHKQIINKLQQAEKLLSSFNPKGVLKRGYSIVRLGNGELVTTVKQMKKGDVIQNELSDGAVTSEVLTKGKNIIKNHKLL